jgi:hypothetical protein
MKSTNWLRDWHVTQRRRGVYVLIGYIDNPFHRYDQKLIRTSRILKIDFLNEYAETKNTIYRLEK